MRTKTPSVLKILALVLAFSAALAAIQGTTDVPAQIGLTATEAKDATLKTLINGRAYSGPAFRAFKALPPSGRAAIVRRGLAWIKPYAQTAEFTTAYAKARLAEKPEPPEWKICCRAGKEATEAAREFARAWLAELKK
jgi:hypothetical protein